MRYALSEARSPRPGGSGVLAKLAEVLFIEVLRRHMQEQGEGQRGWLAAVAIIMSAQRWRHCTASPHAPLRMRRSVMAWR